MNHLPRSGNRHHPLPAGSHPQPFLIRCKSENQSTSPPFTAISSNKSNTFTRSRSISTTKTQNHKEPEVNHVMINLSNSPAIKKKPTENKGSKMLPRKKPISPSAWALSPGRVTPCPSPQPVKPPSPCGKSTSRGINGVLKYFRPKKIMSTDDIDVHRFKLINNMLLQWRFANARAESSMSTVKAVTEKKLFNAWLEILAIRNSNVVKRMKVQKFINDIKLYHIMNSQMFLLEKWSRIEAKNFEAVGRVVRKLTVASLNIPLLHDSKGDVLAVCDVLDKANTFLADIESMITKLYDQVDKSCYLLTELSIIAKQEHESLAELQTWMTEVALLKEREKSLRAHLMQTK